MSINHHSIISIAVISILLFSQTLIADKWDDADLEIKRLSPSELKNIPKRITNELIRRGCTIPQDHSAIKQSNIINGEFAIRGQTDWAVLCSIDNISSIQIIWGGSITCPADINKSPDRDWLQYRGDGKIGYTRILARTDEENILASYEAFGGPRPPPITHDAIEDIVDGRASSIMYCKDGKWLGLQGAD